MQRSGKKESEIKDIEIKEQRRIFITGTDTEVGKTLFTTALIKALTMAEVPVMAVKPVAAGCETIAGEARNEDALAIIEALPQPVAYAQVNPIALRHPVAPHIAARAEEITLGVQTLSQACQLQQFPQPFVLVEGAGGWLVPLNSSETLADFAAAQGLEIILVVGLKLGCINHALLTQQSIIASGLKLAGWVANHIDPDMDCQSENLHTLKQLLKCPLIAEIPFLEQEEQITSAARYVRIDRLISHN